MTPPGSKRAQNARKAFADQQGRANTEASAVRLNLRRRQRIALQHDTPNHLFLVESGCLTLDAILPEDRRQVMQILYPGDLISRAASPPVPQAGLTAVRASVVLRFREDGNASSAIGAPPATADRSAALARLAARSGLHAIAIGRLTGEERFASLLIEMALRMGHTTPGGISFELPLSRNDMADYLALNPDTLSRLMSRLRSRGIVSMPSRSRAIVRDFDELARLSPLADALRHLDQNAPTRVSAPDATAAAISEA